MRFIRLKWKVLLKLLGPIFFIFLILRVVDPKATVNIIRTIKPEFAIASLLLFVVVNAALTFRWWVICQRVGMGVAFKELFQVYYISWFLSIIPFAAISPISKFIYLKDEGKPNDITAVSITLDKLFDIIGLMFFSLFGIIYFPQSFFKDLHLWIYFAGMAFLVMAIFVFGSRIWNILKELLRRYSSKKIQKFGDGLQLSLTKFWSEFDITFFSLLLGISIIIGLLRSLILYLLAISLNIQVSFGLIIACRALFGIVNVVPITVSGLGTRDAILLPALSLSGVSKEFALALGFVAFLWTLCSKITGIIFWIKRPLPLSCFRTTKEKLTE
jgi:uncharacterized protein (TIRG00374 family)